MLSVFVATLGVPGQAWSLEVLVPEFGENVQVLVRAWGSEEISYPRGWEAGKGEARPTAKVTSGGLVERRSGGAGGCLGGPSAAPLWGLVGRWGPRVRAHSWGVTVWGWPVAFGRLVPGPTRRSCGGSLVALGAGGVLGPAGLGTLPCGGWLVALGRLVLGLTRTLGGWRAQRNGVG